MKNQLHRVIREWINQGDDSSSYRTVMSVRDVYVEEGEVGESSRIINGLRWDIGDIDSMVLFNHVLISRQGRETLLDADEL
jgi:hypothetical protein